MMKCRRQRLRQKWTYLVIQTERLVKSEKCYNGRIRNLFKDQEYTHITAIC